MITENEILEKYPKIFKNKDLPMTQTCMCWGLEVPDSWLPTIDILCNSLQNSGYTSGECRQTPQLVADQVKSKFNQLRFYYHLEWPDDFEFNCDEETEKWVVRGYMKYYDGMISLSEDILYKLEDGRRVSHGE